MATLYPFELLGAISFPESSRFRVTLHKLISTCANFVRLLIYAPSIIQNLSRRVEICSVRCFGDSDNSEILLLQPPISMCRQDSFIKARRRLRALKTKLNGLITAALDGNNILMTTFRNGFGLALTGNTLSDVSVPVDSSRSLHDWILRNEIATYFAWVMRLLADAQIQMNGVSVNPVVYGQIDSCRGHPDFELHIPNLELYLDAVQRCVYEFVNVLLLVLFIYIRLH